jgi:hypothetical protein
MAIQVGCVIGKFAFSIQFPHLLAPSKIGGKKALSFSESIS